MSAAACLECDSARVRAWYIGDPIASLGNCTAARLVSEGRGVLVVRFLRDIITQERRIPEVHGNVVDMTRRLRRAVAGRGAHTHKGR
jgi:hypothetical protein